MALSPQLRGRGFHISHSFFGGLATLDGAVRVCSNRCMALLMLKKVTKALADAEKACELRPDWEKAHFRRGRALEDLERYEESLAAYMRSAEIDPTPEVCDLFVTKKAAGAGPAIFQCLLAALLHISAIHPARRPRKRSRISKCC